MIDPEVLAVLQLAPVEFDAYCSDPANRDRLQRMGNELEGIAIGAARLVAYMRQREGMGCGDQGHEEAVDESNRVVHKLRNAFGYNITHPINF